MNRPRRWLEEADTPDEARELLRAGRGPAPMTAEQRSRTGARAVRLLAVPVAGGLLFWLKGVAIAAGLFTAAAGLYHGIGSKSSAHTPVVAVSSSSRPGIPAAPSQPPEVDRAAPPASASAAATEDVEEAPAPRRAKTPATTPPTQGSPRASASVDEGDSLAREVEYLEQARALVASRPAEAIQRLERHAVAFPKGKLGMEREFLIVDALRRTGRSADARRRGEALLARSKDGLYKERVKRMLGSLQ
jgi:hypothetical protein